VIAELEDEFDGPPGVETYEDIKQAQISEAAELLRCVGDQIQAEFGDQIDSVVRQINWTLPRHEMLNEIRRLSGELVQRVNNGWLRVSAF